MSLGPPSLLKISECRSPLAPSQLPVRCGSNMDYSKPGDMGWCINSLPLWNLQLEPTRFWIRPDSLMGSLQITNKNPVTLPTPSDTPAFRAPRAQGTRDFLSQRTQQERTIPNLLVPEDRPERFQQLCYRTFPEKFSRMFHYKFHYMQNINIIKYML